jgi:predicted RNA-binding protein with EMAP domain
MKRLLKSRKDKKPKQAEENDELEFLKWQIRDLNRKIRDFGREVDKFVKESKK